MDKSVDIPGAPEVYCEAITAKAMVSKATMVLDRVTGEAYDPEAKFAELLKQDWFVEQLTRMRLRDQGYVSIEEQEPAEFEQVLVTDGTEFRVLHREEGSWAFEVAPCDRTAMKYWKKLVD
jgi:hypothetical protein